MKQNNIIELTFEKMKELLGLDDDHKIKVVINDTDCIRREVIGFVIEGPRCHQVPEGTPMAYRDLSEFIGEGR
jgi:hypothetical protein